MLNLERNVGRTDKNIRIAVGIVFLLLWAFKGGFLYFLIGVIALATGLLSFCALYRFIGMNTASAEEQQTAKPDLGERVAENFDDFKDEVVETSQEAKHKVEEFVDEHRDDAEALVSKAKQKAGEIADDIKEEVAELKDDAEEAIQTAKKKIDGMTKKS